MKITLEMDENLVKLIDEFVELSYGCYDDREEFIKDAIRCRVHQVMGRFNE